MSRPKINWNWYGWKLLLLISIGHYFGWAASTLHTFGLFVLPVSQEFGWTRSQISLAHTLGTITMVIAAPIAGVLLDKHGPKAIIMPALAGLGILHCALTLIDGSLLYYYAIYVFLAIVGAGTIGPVYARLIFAWFDLRKGLALGILLGGAALSNIINPPLLTWMIETGGWRRAFLFMGCMNLFVVLPTTIFFVRNDPREMGLTRDGVEGGASAATVPRPGSEFGFTYAEAIRQPVFWKLAVLFFLLAFGQAAAVVLIPLLRSSGIDAAFAAIVASVFGGAMLIARLLGGSLMDHFPAAKVSAVIAGASVLGYALLLFMPGMLLPAIAAACLIGLIYGAESDFMGLFVVSYFGRLSSGKIHTTIFSIFACGSAAGVYASGLMFDHFGTYSYTLMIALGTAAAAVLLLTTFGPYPELPLRQRKESAAQLDGRAVAEV